MIRRSEVSRRKPCTRAVATITQSPGSRSAFTRNDTSRAISIVIGKMRRLGADSSALNISFRLNFRRIGPALEKNAISTRVISLIANGSRRRVISLRMRVCSRESLCGSLIQRRKMWVSIKTRKNHLPLRFSNHIPKIRSIEIDNVTYNLDLASENAFERFPRFLLHRLQNGYRTATLCHSDRISATVDFI